MYDPFLSVERVFFLTNLFLAFPDGGCKASFSSYLFFRSARFPRHCPRLFLVGFFFFGETALGMLVLLLCVSWRYVVLYFVCIAGIRLVQGRSI